MSDKKRQISRAKYILGRDYHGIKSLSKDEAILANMEEKKLLKSLSGEVNWGFKRSKIFFGKLSPGCLICGQGKWSGVSTTDFCTANCFYCPFNQKRRKEAPPTAEWNIVFDDPQDYVDYLNKFNIKGVGFTGGECMLVFDKLLLYVAKIKQSFGKKIYVWIYTNGDLVDADKLRKLKSAGLDEIRFNISAGNYNLHPVGLAINIINTVTVEIPAIPEDFGVLKKCISKMQKMGVDHLNLHQLIASKNNYHNFIDRNYTFIHDEFGLSILESEMTALKLIRYAIDNGIRLPINYCSSAYKCRFQHKGLRARLARFVKKEYEEKTSAGYIRRISIKESPLIMKRIINILKKVKCREGLWAINDPSTHLFIHPTLLKYLDSLKLNLSVTYYTPQIKTKASSREGLKKIELNPRKTIFIRRALISKIDLGLIAVDVFRKLFIENTSTRYLLKAFSLKHDFSSGEKEAVRKEIIGLKNTLRKDAFEELETGFPEIY